MDDRLKVLFIFYYFGEGSASGFQNRRLVESLNKHNLDYKILFRYSNDIITNISKVEKIEIKSSVVNKLVLRFLPNFNAVTFDEICWTIKVIYKLNKDIKNFNLIHISSSPFFIQFIGYYFKLRKKIKWIAQLLDPISDNTFFNKNRFNRYCLLRIEKEIVKHSDLILFNNSRTLNRFRDKYLETVYKFKLLPHITYYNLNLSNKVNSKITLYHAGGLYGLRKIDFIINSLLILRNKLISFENIEIHFVGYCLESEKKKVETNGLQDYIFFHNPVANRQLIAMLKKADGLIAIDALTKENLFSASKLCEYFSFQKIIFAITPKESVTHDLLNGTGHFCFNEGDEDLFSSKLELILKNRYCFVDSFKKDLYKDFLPGMVANKYFDYITRI